MAGEKPKSLVDAFGVVNKAFPTHPDYVNPTAPANPAPELEIVGNCPDCGAPVYGQKQVKQGGIPVTMYSCACRGRVKDLGETIRHT